MTKKDEIKPKKSKKTVDSDKIEELTQDLQRMQAEFLNYKARSDKDKQLSVEFGKEQAVASLMPILDNLERAIAHEPEDIKDHKWVQGIGAVVKQLENQLKDIGLIQFGMVGDEFNPELHEAVSMLDGDGEKEIVIGVAQVGYLLDGRVVRHAIVQVGRE